MNPLTARPRGAGRGKAPRILHVATRHKLGGAERNLAQSIEWELDHGYDVHVAVGRDSDLAKLPQRSVSYLIPSLRRDPHPAFDTRALRELVQLIRLHRFDVVHTHQSKAGVLGRLAAARAGVPAVVHTIHMPSFGPSYGRLGSLAFRSAERYCGRRTTLFVSVGDEVRRLYIEAGVGRPDQYMLGRSALDVDAFVAVRSVSAERRNALRTSFGLDPDLPTALAIGSVEPRKRHVLLLERLAPMLRSGEAQFLLAGCGPELDAVRTRAAELNVSSRVILANYILTPAEVFATADVLVHASTLEGVPQVVVQALAAGLPVVASEVEGLREIPGAGVTILDRTAAGLANAVRNVLTTRREPLPPERFDEWRPESVARSLDELHARLEAIVAGFCAGRRSSRGRVSGKDADREACRRTT